MMGRHIKKNIEFSQKISVVNARAYLLSRGWVVAEKIGDKALMMSNEASEEGILLPLRETFSDYGVRLKEMIDILSELEDRSPLSIIKEINLSGFDIFRIKLLESTSDGTVSINSAPNIVDRAQEMLASAASAMLNPKKVFSSRRSRDVDDYMRKVRLGQTEIGSYIFTLLSPVAPVLSSSLPLPFMENLVETEDPPERNITSTLDTAIKAAYATAQRAIAEDDISVFESVVSKGISANFCEALSAITKEAGATEFSVSWGTVRPKLTSPKEVRPVFTLPIADVLEEAARAFRAVEPMKDLYLTGYIKSLDKDKLDPSGNVLMKANLDGAWKSIKLGLSDDDYSKAIEAHADYKTVSVTGELIQHGKFKSLIGVRNFKIEKDEDEK